MIVDLVLSEDSKSIIDFAPASALEEIIQNVKNIFMQIKGSIPYQRDMGFDEDIIDRSVESAIMMYQIDMLRQIKKYEPRASIKSFDWKSSDIVNGQLNPKVTIYINEVYL